MLDIVNYSQRENQLFDVGVADALSKNLVSRVLLKAIPDDEGIHLRCFESTHELLLEQLSQHKLDIILSDCPIDSAQSPGLFSVKIGESVMSFFCSGSTAKKSFPAIIEDYKLLIPGSRTAMGRKLMHWFDSQGITPNILGEFDDAALMKAFGANHQAMFVAPTFYSADVLDLPNIQEIAKVKELKEEYYVIFAERMIQHPAVKRICEADFGKLFH